VLVRSIGVHDEDLVALQIAAGGLKDEAFSIGRPIGLGVFTAVGQLTDIGDIGRVPKRGSSKKADKKRVHKRLVSMMPQRILSDTYH
jgi:hypothetical protein